MIPTPRPLPPGETFTLRSITLNPAARPIVLGTAEHEPCVISGWQPLIACDPSGGKAFLARLCLVAGTLAEMDENEPVPTTPSGNVTPLLEPQS